MKEDDYKEWEDESDMMNTIPYWIEDDILARDNDKYLKKTSSPPFN